MHHQPTPIPVSSAERVYLFAIAAWASFATMAVEVLFARLAASYFGTGIAVWGSIITVLLVSMAAGYLVGGKLSEKPHPSTAVLYTLVLVLAATMLPLFTIAGAMLDMIADWVPDPRYGSLLAAITLLGAAGFAAGTIAPYVTRLIVTCVEEAGARVGQLSAVTTLGSAAGTILPSYYLVLWLEINTILVLVTAITAVAALAGLIARSRQRLKLSPGSPQATAARPGQP